MNKFVVVKSSCLRYWCTHPLQSVKLCMSWQVKTLSKFSRHKIGCNYIVFVLSSDVFAYFMTVDDVLLFYIRYDGFSLVSGRFTILWR